MFIKRPSLKRRSYAIVGPDGKTMSDPRIEAVNADLRAGMPRDLLEARMQQILNSLRPTPVVRYEPSVSNLLLVQKCMERKTDIVRRKDAEASLRRGAGLVGEVDLRTASLEEVEAALRPVKKKSRRDVIRAVNELLIFAGRPFTIPNPLTHSVDDIAHIRITDFQAKAVKLAEQNQVIALTLGALFASGCRWGELPLARLTLDSVGVHVSKQYRRDGTMGPTKNKRTRISPLLPPLSAYFMKYQELSPVERKDIRLRLEKRAYLICKKVLGIRTHDLRHSYAIEWGGAGFSMSEVAKFIGDTEEATARHYLPFSATPDEVSRAVLRFSSANKSRR